MGFIFSHASKGQNWTNILRYRASLEKHQRLKVNIFVISTTIFPVEVKHSQCSTVKVKQSREKATGHIILTADKIVKGVRNGPQNAINDELT